MAEHPRQAGQRRERSQNYALWLNTTNQVVASSATAARSVSVYSPTTLDTNWHYVAATYDNATAKVYVDGVLKVLGDLDRAADGEHSAAHDRPHDRQRPHLRRPDRRARRVHDGALRRASSRPTTTRPPRFDTTPPAVTLTSPADGATTNDHAPTFSGAAGTAAGDSSTVTVKIYAGLDRLRVARADADDDAERRNWSRPASPALADGTYTAQAEQADGAGNLGHEQRQRRSRSRLPTSPPPAVTLTNPADGSSSTEHDADV